MIDRRAGWDGERPAVLTGTGRGFLSTAAAAPKRRFALLLGPPFPRTRGLATQRRHTKGWKGAAGLPTVSDPVSGTCQVPRQRPGMDSGSRPE